MSHNRSPLFSQKPVYFGGSRHFPLSQGNWRLVAAILKAAGFPPVHVGCQVGLDNLVIHVSACMPVKSLHIFCVASNWQEAPAHVRQLGQSMPSAQITLSAGGQSAPIKARYLLRSKAAFQGCCAAVFFSPGPGSLAVAREAIAAGLPVYAFVQEQPAAVPATAGSWVRSSFHGFTCWQFQPAQVPLI